MLAACTCNVDCLHMQLPSLISVKFVITFPDACLTFSNLRACYMIGCQKCVTAMLCEFADTLGVHHLQVEPCYIQHLQKLHRSYLKLSTNLH